MKWPRAGGRGPHGAVRIAYTRPVDATGVDLTGAIVATVAVVRPNGTPGPTWSTADASLSVVSPTTTTMELRHVLATDGSDLPFVSVNGNTVTCEYKFIVEIFCDGAFVERFTKCQTLMSEEVCCS